MSTESLTTLAYRYMETGQEHDGIPYFPHRAYREYLRIHPLTQGPKLYASMAITSAGYKRDPELGPAEVPMKNTSYGNRVREYLAANNLGPDKVIIPSELGSMRQAAWAY